MNVAPVNRRTLRRRSLRFHWRAGLAVVFGTMAGAAALIGALFVGDSMRASLREQALARLGPVDYAVDGGRFFGETLAEKVAADDELKVLIDTACPVVTLRASVTNASGDSRVNGVQALGVDERFWRMFGDDELKQDGRAVILNQPLADSLGVRAGDDVLLRLPKPGAAPLETLLGRRDDTIASLRLTVAMIIPASGAGAFALRPQQAVAQNAFVPLATMQRALGEVGRVNTMLVVAKNSSDRPTDLHEELSRSLDAAVTLVDLNLSIRVSDTLGCAAVESTNLLVEPQAEEAALATAGSLKLDAVPVLTYLANSISVAESADRPGSTIIPYSTIAALDPGKIPPGQFVLADGSSVAQLGDDEILLNEWAASDLGASVGQTISLSYFVTRPGGRLEEQTARFKLTGIVRMTGWAGDSGLTPTYEGITNAKRLSDWDPPFPFDMKRIRQKDEDYWDKHQALPKAFVSRAAGQKHWNADSRFGSYTAIRVVLPEGKVADESAQALETAMRSHLRAERMGFAFRPVREEALAAGSGSTDFGQLFIGFSSFLIIAAALLVALMFRLGVQRRAEEVGLLLAIGFGVRRVRKMLISEGTLLVVMGSAAGLLLAGGYAWLMLAGLRTWWAAAVNAPFLRLAASPTSMAIGLVVSMVIARLAIGWSVRVMARSSARSLLSGEVTSGSHLASPRKRAVIRAVCLIALLGAIGTAFSAISAGGAEQAVSFFIAGFAMLIALLSAVWLWLIARPGATKPAAVQMSMFMLAARNARRQPARSLLATGLIASATFVIVAVGASRLSPDMDIEKPSGGAGGFSLVAESTVPLPYDIKTAQGRESLGINGEAAAICKEASFAAFRVRPGDDSSCLNLYKVNQPRILGAGEDFLQRGAFSFAASMAESAEEKANPWLLLNRRFEDGAIPAIGDESAVRWLLHLDIGGDMEITDERGQLRKLRIVAMLSGSVMQSELIIDEAVFKNHFPSIGGYSAFLIATNDDAELTKALERDLSRFGFDAEPTRDRLTAYMAVQNTYLSTFQTLGGLGLLLGVFGLAAVMMRNIWERRGELALLRALGFRASQLYQISMLEHATLLLTGLAAGVFSALVAVGPHAMGKSDEIPWASLAGTIVLVFMAGLAAGAICIRSTLKTPLLAALRRE